MSWTDINIAGLVRRVLVGCDSSRFVIARRPPSPPWGPVPPSGSRPGRRPSPGKRVERAGGSVRSARGARASPGGVCVGGNGIARARADRRSRGRDGSGGRRNEVLLRAVGEQRGPAERDRVLVVGAHELPRGGVLPELVQHPGAPIDGGRGGRRARRSPRKRTNELE